MRISNIFLLSLFLYRKSCVSTQIKKTFNSEALAMLAITICWLVMTAAVNPIGNFPLNDDWAYAESVKTLLTTNKIVIPDWSAANFFTQAIWGWLFTAIFGFSFTVLRFSTLTLGLLGVIAAFKLSREIGVPIIIAVLGALILMINPIYFASSNTFMTDIPFFTISTLALLFLTKVINTDDTVYLILGIITLGLALLIRQLGFAIAIAYAFSYLLGRKLSLNSVFRALAPLIVCILIQVIFRFWLSSNDQVPSMYGHQINQIKDVLSLAPLEAISIFGGHAINTLLYIGLFLSPLLLLVWYYQYDKLTLNKTLQLVLIVILMYIVFRAIGMSRWPLVGNVLGPYGIGPMLQHGSVDYSILHNSGVKFFWKLVGVLSIWFTGYMLYIMHTSILKKWSDYKNQALEVSRLRVQVFFLFVVIVYCLPTFLVQGFFDRYLLLPILAGSTLIQSKIHIQAKLSRLRFVIIILMVTLIAALTIAATYDYLSWNRARWMALNDLVYKTGISPTRIDGGFEFNGMYLYSKEAEKTPNKKGWWVADNEYLIAYTLGTETEAEGYKALSIYPVISYLPFSPKNIYVLHRK
jgi:hypothetical protein